MKDLEKQYIVMILDDKISNSRVFSGAIGKLAEELEHHQSQVRVLTSYSEAFPVLGNEMNIDAVLLAVDPDGDELLNRQSDALLDVLKKRQRSVPVFLLADRSGSAGETSLELMEKADEYIWILEDSPEFIAGRIRSAVCRYRSRLLPPLMQAVWDYNEEFHEYSWAAPGHQGGRGFTKSPAGRKFYDFYDENLFRTDTGIERSSIGSLLDHTGAFAESERQAAEVFGAHYSFSGIVGSSGSNRTIMQSVLSPGDVAVCDRNCHKSIEQGLILTGAVPVYMPVTRNVYGIIGPVLPQKMTPQSIAESIGRSPLGIQGKKPSYAVLTNCTYDGLCYRSDKVEQLLGKSCSRIHFDEAWYAYARFNPMYRNCHAMRGDSRDYPQNAPTVFATHSTHKLLAALSQSSYIHVRNGRDPVPAERLNLAYMMHTTTSPLYAICVSNDISARMMAESGFALTQEVIDEAVDFRRSLARICRDYARKNSWFFQVWNTPRVKDVSGRKSWDFADAPVELLTHHQECWRLVPGESWHGFAGLEDDWAMLDPIKVSILTPGITPEGEFSGNGIPAELVAAYLYREGIIPTRSTDFQLMFLFSIGITKGKWMTLLDLLLEFKELYDRNAPLVQVLPDLVARDVKRYGHLGLRELGDMMYDYIRTNQPTAKLSAAFDSLPEQIITPRDAYMHLVRNQAELVPAEELADRVAAASVIPYPPGIPLLMSGEKFGPEQLKYLRLLSDWDRHFPGFEHDVEGSQVIDGSYFFWCAAK